MLVLEAAKTLAGVASVASKVTTTVLGMTLSGGIEVYKVIYQGQLPNAAATLYTVPASTVAMIRTISVVNTDSSARTFQLFVGGTTDANAITPVVTIPAGGWAEFDGDGWSVYDSTGAVAVSSVASFAIPALTYDSSAAAGVASTAVRSDATLDVFDATPPTTQALGDAAAVGTAGKAARRDHKHGLPALGTTAAAIGTSAGGSATTPSKSDHVHATGAGTPSTQAFGDAAAVGSGPAAAMTDHKHAMPSERAASSTTPAAIGTAAIGVGATDARADHVHATGAGTPAAVSTAAAVGSGPAAAMTDHVHAHETAHTAHDAIWDAAGDLAVGTGADTAAKLALTVPAANILEVLGVVNGETTPTWKAAHDATNPAAIGTVAPGTALTAAHRDHVHATGAGTPSTQAFGDAAAVGSGPAAAMTDHKHAMPAERAASSTTPAAVGTAAVGTGTTDARSDHVHATGAGTPSTQAFGDAAAVGSGPAAAMTDHKHAMPANPKLGSLFVAAAAMTPSTTSGCKAPTLVESATNKQNKWLLDFIDASTTYAEALMAMPSDYDGGTFTATFYWSNANTTGNVVRWQVEARSYGDAETYDQAFGTAVAVNDTYSTTANQVMISAATGAVTPSGTPAANELMHFRFARVGGDAADTLTTDARLLGVKIVYTRT